jgi:hypothetical protein
MYNDKIGYSEGLRRREAMTVQKRNPSCACSDRPVASVTNDLPQMDAESRRLCDGSLRNQQSNTDNCLGGTGWGLKDHPLGMMYSPYQYFRQLYSPDTALSRGTIFSELDLPFEGYKH